MFLKQTNQVDEKLLDYGAKKKYLERLSRRWILRDLAKIVSFTFFFCIGERVADATDSTANPIVAASVCCVPKRASLLNCSVSIITGAKLNSEQQLDWIAKKAIRHSRWWWATKNL